jgi:hypothetical protein
MKLRHFVPAAALLCFAACASRPQLYPNEKLKTVGKEASQNDIDECMKLADDYVSSGKGKKIAAGAGKGAAVGAAGGAVAGAFHHNALGGGILGGAVGAAVGGTSSALSPDQVKRNFTNQCLSERGYKVIGWE